MDVDVDVDVPRPCRQALRVLAAIVMADGCEHLLPTLHRLLTATFAGT